MTKQRKRIKQTVSLKDRLTTFAEDLRKAASDLPPGDNKQDLLKRALKADAALDMDRWAARSAESRRMHKHPADRHSIHDQPK